MTQRTQSTASVLRVKGVSFNYLNFLWRKLDLISRAEEQGNYAIALSLCAKLVPWLPRSIKAEFMEKALKIQQVLNLIRGNGIPELYNITDIHLRTAKRNWLLNAYSAASLTTFVNDLTTKLDSMGYMENTKQVTEGTAEGDPDWRESYEAEKAAGANGKTKPSKKKKKEPVPTGGITD